MKVSVIAFPIVVMFVILSIILQWKMPVIKGKYGEWVVKAKLRKLGDADTVYHDVYIPNGEREENKNAQSDSAKLQPCASFAYVHRTSGNAGCPFYHRLFTELNL
ncbi:hypothetical protein [Sporosarcina sp. SAFN-015]|uniref:hypothetical protein n=1 Tax=Sporosarcina sp. SAFN-015 TaxID=3387274 RepID=UPI003F812F2A